MKRASTIKMDFNRAIRQAEELEDIARRMRNMANRELDETLQNLSGAWRGEAASLYMNKGNQLKNKIIQSARNLEHTASAIRKIAAKTYQAEMNAYRLAQERLYREQ